jgi:hypothetical protein
MPSLMNCEAGYSLRYIGVREAPTLHLSADCARLVTVGSPSMNVGGRTPNGGQLFLRHLIPDDLSLPTEGLNRCTALCCTTTI